MTQSKVVLTQRPTIPFTAPNTVVLYVQDDRLYMKDDEQEIFLVGPIASDVSTILSYTEKIDDVAVDGLTGVQNSLAYKVANIERDLIGGARWFEAAATPDGEDHVADRIGSGSGAFQMDAGNDTWGDWLQILGSDDTPVMTGRAYFSPRRFIVEDTERATTYFVQMGRGASGDAALTANNYTEFVYSATVQKDVAVMEVHTGRAPAGSKVWIRCMCPGNDTATMDFYFGITEFEG